MEVTDDQIAEITATIKQEMKEREDMKISEIDDNTLIAESKMKIVNPISLLRKLCYIFSKTWKISTEFWIIVSVIFQQLEKDETKEKPISIFLIAETSIDSDALASLSEDQR